MAMQCGTDELAEESWEIKTRIMESNYLKNNRKIQSFRRIFKVFECQLSIIFFFPLPR